jgi:hypothetical protein
MTDKAVIRALAEQYLAGIDPAERARRIENWRAINSLRAAPPPVYIRAFAWREAVESQLVCEDPNARDAEQFFRYHIFQFRFADDMVYNPWRQSWPCYKSQGWGLNPKLNFANATEGLEAYKMENPIQDYAADLAKLAAPRLQIDEAATDARESATLEMIGDLMPVEVYRGAWTRGWSADIAMALGSLRGMENLMSDVYDDPDNLKRLAAFLRDGVLSLLDETERAGQLTLLEHFNQAMPYADGLPDPAPNVRGVAASRLWHFQAAQEFALIGPAQHREFLLEFQKEIFKRYALVAYGCCEDLTNKISMLREIPNLRRIAVAPFANVAKCAEQIGADYTISYRPNPALLAAGYDKERLRAKLREDFAALRANGCIFDVTLKDVETLEGDFTRIADFIEIVRDLSAA